MFDEPEPSSDTSISRFAPLLLSSANSASEGLSRLLLSRAGSVQIGCLGVSPQRRNGAPRQETVRRLATAANEFAAAFICRSPQLHQRLDCILIDGSPRKRAIGEQLVLSGLRVEYSGRAR